MATSPQPQASTQAPVDVHSKDGERAGQGNGRDKSSSPIPSPDSSSGRRGRSRTRTTPRTRDSDALRRRYVFFKMMLIVSDADRRVLVEDTIHSCLRSASHSTSRSGGNSYVRWALGHTDTLCQSPILIFGNGLAELSPLVLPPTKSLGSRWRSRWSPAPPRRLSSRSGYSGRSHSFDISITRISQAS